MGRGCLDHFLVFFLLCDVALGGRDFYRILDVSKDAGLKDIKSAYREKAKVLHPDKNPDDPDSEEKFQDLTAAYEVLSDRKKREIYDRSGEEGVQKMDGGGGGGGHDPFSSFFGDFFGGGSQERDDETPRELILLWICTSHWKSYMHEMRTQQMGQGRFQMFQVKVCDNCPNVKLVNHVKNLEVEIEVGADEGHEMRFVGEGEPHIEGDPGDLIFKLRVQKHKIFERRGLDLYTNVTISLKQALSGLKWTLSTWMVGKCMSQEIR
uniref:J domain-containing protein n=1 Tax=Ditylenchus dipsaci TaxID=166011 RepID=A0A915DSR6_9BILA